MSDILIMILIVVLHPILYILTIGFWGLIGLLFDKIHDVVYPPEPPYCDIDPCCHSRFIWKDGNGYIDGVKVI